MFEYFIKNRQCKLPWTVDEINRAIKDLMEKIEKFNFKFKI